MNKFNVGDSVCLDCNNISESLMESFKQCGFRINTTYKVIDVINSGNSIKINGCNVHPDYLRMATNSNMIIESDGSYNIKELT